MKVTEKQLRRIIREELVTRARRQKLAEATAEQVLNTPPMQNAFKGLANLIKQQTKNEIQIDPDTIKAAIADALSDVLDAAPGQQSKQPTATTSGTKPATVPN